MEGKCLHEAKWGTLEEKVKNLQFQISNNKSSISDLQNNNSTIIELTIQLQNLIREVKELCDKMQKYGERIDKLERAEGEELKELKKAIQADLVKKVSLAVVAAVLSFFAGMYV